MNEPKANPQLGLLGCGHRAVAGFILTLKGLGRSEYVTALCDTNPVRLAYAAKQIPAANPTCYTEFEKFLAHEGLDTVIVATPDDTHCDLVVRCFAAGKNVVCEKPMATSREDCLAILRAQGDKALQVAFNFRYNPVCRKTKELLSTGIIGNITYVEAQDILGRGHGSDYFRRWHRLQHRSGGLLTHKSVHAFDVVNWWLDDLPASVNASADRLFYRPERQQGERCRDCISKNDCEFSIDLNEDIPGQVAGLSNFYRHMYLEAEDHDGYIRDTCVFHKSNTTPDTYQVTVNYRRGTIMNYSCVTYAPYEDRRFILQGDKGRLEISRQQRTIHVYHGEENRAPEVITVPEELGGHGGADVLLVKAMLGDGEAKAQLAPPEAGYWSVAISDAAIESIQKKQLIQIPKLINLPGGKTI